MTDTAVRTTAPAASSEATPARPSAALLPRGWARQPAFVYLLLGGLVCTIFSGNSAYMGLPISPDRVLIPLAIALALLDPNVPRPRWRMVYGLMGGLLLWTLISMTTHGTLTSQLALFGLVDRLIMPFALFVVGPMVFTTVVRRELLLITLTALGAYLGLTAVAEVIGPHSLVFPRYIMNPDLGILFGRARGPFLGAEAMGMALIITAMATGLLAHAREGVWRWVCVLLLPMQIAGLVLTMTRSIWVGGLIGLLAIGWFVKASRPYLVAASITGVALVGWALSAFPDLAETLMTRLTTQRSLYDRQNTNDAALQVLWERPWDGVGWSRFLDVGQDWVRQSDEYPITNVVIEVHNVFLARAAELGIPAAVVFVLCVWFGPVNAVRGLRTRGVTLPIDHGAWRLFGLITLCSWIVPSLTSPNPYPFPNVAMWMICGIAGAHVVVRRAATGQDVEGASPTRATTTSMPTSHSSTAPPPPQ